MLRQEFEVTLKDNVIISQSSATTGQHQSLDYIPGSVFLGIAAAQLYKDLEKDQLAWEVFHSGRVRFGNATLVAAAERTIPIPMAFHTRKGASWKEEVNGLNYLKAGEVFSFLASSDAIRAELNTDQPVQIRSGYLNQSGAIVSPQMHFEMKTAVNEFTNVAAENQLFGYQSLKAGQTFRFVLESDNDEQPLFDRLVAVFDGQIRVGRSRSAQFGRALCTRVDSSVASDKTEATHQVSLLCCSDLALVDLHGNATYLPQAADVGLPPDWQFDLANSFIRTRHYSPYNGKRRAYDLERQVISKGSVLTFTGGEAISISQEFYAGLYREQGLGALQRMPAWMTQLKVEPHADPQAHVTDKAVQAGQAEVPDSKLIRWLLKQQNQGQADNAWVDQLLNQYGQLLKNAYVLNGIPTNIEIGPSKSQWGAVYQALRTDRHQSAQHVKNRLFNQTGALCKPAGSDEYAWSLDVIDQHTEQPVTLSSWLEHKINQLACADDQQFISTLILLADQLKRDPKQRLNQQDPNKQNPNQNMMEADNV